MASCHPSITSKSPAEERSSVVLPGSSWLRGDPVIFWVGEQPREVPLTRPRHPLDAPGTMEPKLLDDLSAILRAESENPTGLCSPVEHCFDPGRSRDPLTTPLLGVIQGKTGLSHGSSFFILCWLLVYKGKEKTCPGGRSQLDTLKTISEGGLA